MFAHFLWNLLRRNLSVSLRMIESDAYFRDSSCLSQSNLCSLPNPRTSFGGQVIDREQPRDYRVTVLCSKQPGRCRRRPNPKNDHTLGASRKSNPPCTAIESFE